MGRLEDDYALLLDGVDHVRAELARSILEAEGIPAMIHGPDFDVVELGIAAHASVRGVSIFVPKISEGPAREALEAAWGDLDSKD